MPPASKYCPGCGGENSAEARYCRQCGLVFDVPGTAAAVATEPARTSLPARMWRAVRLESSVYTEVAADGGANRQAWTVVALAAVAGGVSAGISTTLRGESFWFRADAPWVLFAGSSLMSLVLVPIMWLLLSFAQWLLATRLFWRRKPSVKYSAVLRATGFSHAISTIGWASCFPYLGTIVSLGIVCLQLAAEVVALRQSLSLSTGKAIGLWVAAFALILPAGMVVLFILLVYRFSGPPSLLSQL